ncbi:acyltransferase family protein [Microbacterium rhizosphaerae]|uniref:Acyltransferase family protein n=1 Tax=Microbacterium rhizosphaerae TaxID=1678237 RepID=A0ABZ0STW3_9MICO|nr:acyltransferase family protein [Microbacterium rhizosphaerae]WPR90826.1 acyltransferase family protein [Microbacterium rhizosphaerae]
MPSDSATTIAAVQPAAASRAGFRTDIQALRAVAITAVVLDHLWPTVFTGGYVGVDVFFVISGFLITGHLFGELARTGRVRLGAFYARRVRRLLPAALLVLIVGAVLVWTFLPYPRWGRNAIEIAASAGYAENWVLAAFSVNYSALNDSATVAQHYWSLSVEEQFYLIWPLLMIGAAVLAVRAGRRGGPRRPVVFTLGAIAVLSLAASIVCTAIAPSQAYFVTFTRAWEFAVGGLIALLAHRIRLHGWWAQMLSALGILMVAAAVALFGPSTAFPGAVALLPVVGTALIIGAGTDGARLWHTSISASRPVQWLGAVSYSLYLWHWPLIVAAPFVLGTEVRTPAKIGILALALVLAWLTKRLVEDPGQRLDAWKHSVRRTMISMLVGMGVVAILAAGLFWGYKVRTAADTPTAPIPSGSCVGPSAMANASHCPDRFGSPGTAVMTAKNEYFYTPPECRIDSTVLKYGDRTTVSRCDFAHGAPTARVWLVGDSHAQQWQAAVFQLARERGWQVSFSYFGGCPVADVAFTGFRVPWGPADYGLCRQWSHDLADEIQKERPDLVVTSMAAREQLVDDGSGRTQGEQFVRGLDAFWTRWADKGIKVLAIADPPLNGAVRSPDCVLLNQGDPTTCARPRDQAQPADPIVRAATVLHRPDVRLFDATSTVCDQAECYAVVGGIPVYYDADHLNLEFVRMLTPWVGRAVDQVLSKTPSP